ncbi:alpha/beta hydrolase family protein [Streptomyces sp. NPDC001667]
MPAQEQRLKRRALLAAGALALTGLLSALTPVSHAHAQQRAQLPAPTGPYAVGTTTRHLVDTGRKDPWKGGDREVMVSLFYPADPGAQEVAPQMDRPSAAHFGSGRGAAVFNYGVKAGAADWAGTRTHARVDVPVARGSRGLPVVLYSSGLGDPRTWNTGLVEELASRGYVVVTVDHTYDSSEVRLPGGRLAGSVLPSLAGAPVEKVDETLRTAMWARVGDSRFVLDTLDDAKWRAGLPRGLGRPMDVGRVGMAGQSAGGFTAAQTMHDDRRVKAGINMDGQMDFPLPDASGQTLSPAAREGVDRPFLLLGSDGAGAADNRPSWDAFRQHTRGWQAEWKMTGAEHGTYTDAPSLLPAFAEQGALTAEQLGKDIGSVPPGRAVAAERAYVVSFFDRFLKGHDDHLLDGPSARFPEMAPKG